MNTHIHNYSKMYITCGCCQPLDLITSYRILAVGHHPPLDLQDNTENENVKRLTLNVKTLKS